MDAATAGIIVAGIAAVPGTIAAVATIRGNRRVEQQLGNGGNSAIDRVISRITERVDGVGAEVAYCTKRTDALHSELQGVKELLTTHLAAHQVQFEAHVTSTGTRVTATGTPGVEVDETN